MNAVLGTFVSIKTMADGTPRMTLDLDCKLADIAALGMIPGTPFGIARITGESTVAEPEKAPAEKPGQLCVMACNFCKDSLFQQWVGAVTGEPYESVTEEVAKQYILMRCRVESRKELDHGEGTERFHRKIRGPFMEYRAKFSTPA